MLLGRDARESLAPEGLTESRAGLLCSEAAWAVHPACARRCTAGGTPYDHQLIDDRVATGFVTREPHPADRRTTLIMFTPPGHATGQGLVEGRGSFRERCSRI